MGIIKMLAVFLSLLCLGHCHDSPDRHTHLGAKNSPWGTVGLGEFCNDQTECGISEMCSNQNDCSNQRVCVDCNVVECMNSRCPFGSVSNNPAVALPTKKKGEVCVPTNDRCEGCLECDQLRLRCSDEYAGYQSCEDALQIVGK